MEEPAAMRPHNNAFVRSATESFDLPGPAFEFGSFQVEGQEEHFNLRGYFAGKSYVGCDFRDGPGVDRVEDVTKIGLASESVGTVLCVETFEHVYAIQDAFAEVFRVLRPGGAFLLTSPFHFRIHAYPDDYWRFTPSLLRRMMAPYGGLIVGSQGPETTPHTVMAMGIKGQAPPDFRARAERMIGLYRTRLAEIEAATPVGQKLRRAVGSLYRSKGERRQVAEYSTSRFTIDEARVGLAVAS
jgi:SAM-dependent methyltransferase